ncbi:hypothetical protein CHISP_1134 [Chitinispirillum alkaliphilum]|nr:hypothetical protein CHISP_1134 [Chitinispirillum alkaliphilum]
MNEEKTSTRFDPVPTGIAVLAATDCNMVCVTVSDEPGEELLRNHFGFCSPAFQRGHTLGCVD